MHVPPSKVLYAVTGFEKLPAPVEEVVKAPEVSSRTGNGAAVGDATSEGSSTETKEREEGKVEEEKEEEEKADDGGGRELYDLRRRKNFQMLLDVRDVLGGIGRWLTR